MDGNDPDLTEGPFGLPFPTNLETAARDKAIRAARQAAKDKAMHAMQLQRQLHLDLLIRERQEQQDAAARDKAIRAARQYTAIAARQGEEVAKLTMIVDCQKQYQANRASGAVFNNGKRKFAKYNAAIAETIIAEKQAKGKEPEKKQDPYLRWSC
jgi:hypothetical protein